MPGELKRSNSCTVYGDSYEFFKIDIPSVLDDNMSRVMSAVRQRERVKSKDLTTGPSVRKNSYSSSDAKPFKSWVLMPHSNVAALIRWARVGQQRTRQTPREVAVG